MPPRAVPVTWGGDQRVKVPPRKIGFPRRAALVTWSGDQRVKVPLRRTLMCTKLVCITLELKA
ncbi:MAG TPA: hypothetical protein VIY28_08790 [Pseudonocardiaceae bacterium]